MCTTMILLQDFCNVLPFLGGIIITIFIKYLLSKVDPLLLLRGRLFASSDSSPWRTKKYPKDTVLFHHTMRGPFCPGLSPFAMKAETYMRMANIPYKNMGFTGAGPKGKLPWFEYNGKVIPDSQLFIEYMNKTLGIDLDKHLTKEQRGVSRAVQRMVDENLYWTSMLHRHLYDTTLDLARYIDLPWWQWPILKIGRKRIAQQAYAHGIGKHTPEEIARICENDLQSLTDILGEKKFMLGDVPTEVDCAVFGQVSTIKWHLEGSDGERMVKEQFHSLDQYCERMKHTLWPTDWDDCTSRGGTCEAKK